MAASHNGASPALLKRLLAMALMWVVSAVVSALVTALASNELPWWLGGGEGGGGVAVPPASDGRLPTMRDVGGMRAAKREVWYQVVLPLKHPQTFFGARARALAPSRGVLLVGPPGTGKTLLARAAARESQAAFFAPTLSDLERKYYGETPKVLRGIFEAARKRAPSIIFFDEIDGLLRTRAASEESSSYGLKTEMLRLLDTIGECDAVIVIACTNHVSVLDPALRRRLPTVVNVPLPTLDERREVVRICTRDEPSAPQATELIQWVAKRTDGLSGSDIAAAHRAAASVRLRRSLGSSPNPSPAQLEQAVSALPALTRADWHHGIRVVASGKCTAGESEGMGVTRDREAVLREALAQCTSKA